MTAWWSAWRPTTNRILNRKLRQTFRRLGKGRDRVDPQTDGEFHPAFDNGFLECVVAGKVDAIARDGYDLLTPFPVGGIPVIPSLTTSMRRLLDSQSHMLLNP